MSCACRTSEVLFKSVRCICRPHVAGIRGRKIIVKLVGAEILPAYGCHGQNSSLNSVIAWCAYYVIVLCTVFYSRI